MESYQKIRLVFLSILLVISPILTMLLFLMIGHLNTTVYQRSIYNYQYLRVNEMKNLTHSGYTQNFRKIEDGEYIYRVFDEGERYLISNVGDDEYKCFGSCYCNSQNDKRRSVSRVLSSGMLYLAASATSLIAYSKAKEHFEKKCNTLSLAYGDEDEQCPPDDIEVNVEGCEVVRFNEREIYVERMPNKYDKYKPDWQTFLCKGNCLKKTFAMERIQKMANEFRCEDLKIQGEVEVDLKQKFVKRAGLEKFTLFKFQALYLLFYCEGESMREVEWFEGEDPLTKKIWLCHAGETKEPNPSIQCRKVKK